MEMTMKRDRAKREERREGKRIVVITHQYILDLTDKQYTFLVESYLREVFKDGKASHLVNFEAYIKYLKERK